MDTVLVEFRTEVVEITELVEVDTVVSVSVDEAQSSRG